MPDDTGPPARQGEDPETGGARDSRPHDAQAVPPPGEGGSLSRWEGLMELEYGHTPIAGDASTAAAELEQLERELGLADDGRDVAEELPDAGSHGVTAGQPGHRGTDDVRSDLVDSTAQGDGADSVDVRSLMNRGSR